MMHAKPQRQLAVADAFQCFAAIKRHDFVPRCLSPDLIPIDSTSQAPSKGMGGLHPCQWKAEISPRSSDRRLGRVHVYTSGRGRPLLQVEGVPSKPELARFASQ